MLKLTGLITIVLAVGGACRQSSPIACRLTPDILLQRQRINMLAIQLRPDTVDINSGDSLCWQPLGVGDSLRRLPAFYEQPRQAFVYGHKISAWYFTDSTGNRLLTTDTTNLSFCTAILNKQLGAKPQGILKIQLLNKSITLAKGIKTGMQKSVFINLLFKNLTPEETACVLQQQAFVLGDPVGEYISSTYSFTSDTLRSITLQSPATYARAQQQ